MTLRRSVVTVFKGSLAAQLIGFIVLPLLSRIYSPEAFGSYQVYLTVLSYLIVIASLRYEVAIMNAPDIKEATFVAVLCIVTNLAVTAVVVITCTVLVLFDISYPFGFGNKIWLFPCAVLLAGVLNTLSYLAIRNKEFRIGVAAKIFQTSSYSVSSICIGYIYNSSISLMFADLIGRFVAILSYLRLQHKNTIQFVSGIGRQHLFELARKYREFPMVSLPGALINTGGSALTPLLIYSTFNAATAGQYSLVERSFGVPIALVSQAVSQVFMANFADALRLPNNQAVILFRKIVFTHMKWGFIPALAVMAIAPQVFSILFGSQWALAGKFSQIMVPLFFVSFIAAPVNMSLVLMGLNKQQVMLDTVRLISVITLWVSVRHFQFDSTFAIILHVVLNSVIYIIFLLLAYRAVRTYNVQTMKNSCD